MLHLLVATVAFIIGVTAANLLGGRIGHRGHCHRFKRAYVERQTQPLMMSEERGCPYSRALTELPVPSEAPDAPDAPPPPPALAIEKKGLRVVTLPDGTRKVIAPQAGELKKY